MFVRCQAVLKRKILVLLPTAIHVIYVADKWQALGGGGVIFNKERKGG